MRKRFDRSRYASLTIGIAGAFKLAICFVTVLLVMSTVRTQLRADASTANKAGVAYVLDANGNRALGV